MQTPFIQPLPEEQAYLLPPEDEDSEAGAGVEALVLKVLALARQARALELASHLIHLNYEGRGFLEVHGFLKGRYEAHLEQFDALAEFVRTLDYLIPWDFCCSTDELPHPLTPGCAGEELLVCYLRNLEAYGMAAKELVECARCAEAPDVENYGAELVADSFKAAWFLKALLRGT
jgi:DNA-binding ferritin-like protein